MRILHMDAGREMRGGQRQVLRLIEGLSAAGVESTLLARAGSPLFDAAFRACWRVEPIGVTRAITLLRSHDLIHAHDARSHTLGAFLRAKPLVVSRRVTFPIGSKWKYGRAARYIAVSEFVKSVLMDGGVPEEKIAVVYDGVPVLEPSHGHGLLALSNGSDPLKGAPLAIEAAQLAGVPLELTNDLESSLPHAAIFVYITHSEGLGSAAILAMSAAVAVIASSIGGLAEVIRHGVDGLLVENRAETIADAIRDLYGNPARAQTLGQTARQSVIDRFTVDRMVRHTLNVYQQVLH